MTQHEKIIAAMVQNFAGGTKFWFRVEWFNNLQDAKHCFIGYKASARINELEQLSPSLFLTQQDFDKPRLKLRMLNTKEMPKIISELSGTAEGRRISSFLVNELARNGCTYLLTGKSAVITTEGARADLPAAML